MMKLVQQVFLFFCCFAALFYLGLYFYVPLQLKPIVEEALREKISKDIRIGAVQFQPPLGVNIERFSIAPIFRAQRVNIQLDPFSLLNQRGRVLIRELSIRRGEIHYIVDVSTRQFPIDVGNISGKAHDIVWPLQPQQSSFWLKGEFAGSPLSMQGSIIQTKGWIDWFSRNMQAAVTIIQPEKKKMIEARAVANHNVLNVEGVLSLPKVAVGSYKDLTADPQQKQDGLNEIPSVDVGIETKFSFQTKLDDPRIEKIRFHGRVKAQTDVPPLSEKLPAPTQQPSVDAAMTTEVVSPPIELPQNSVQNSSDFPAEDSK